MPTPEVVLYDGTCGLCSRWVVFVVRHDAVGRFRFAPLQSETGRRLLREHRLPEQGHASMVLIADGAALTRSAAVIGVVRRLGGPFRAFAILSIVPRPVRDRVYDWMARNRYRWFGSVEACEIPDPAVRERFPSMSLD